MPFIFLVFFLVLMFIILQLGIFGLVLTKLGLSPDSAILLLGSTLLGSTINLKLFTIDSDFDHLDENQLMLRSIFNIPKYTKGKTDIALNVGGALIPVLFSLYLLSLYSLNIMHVVVATSIVTFLSYKFSVPVKGFGIGMPILVAPLSAAISALIIDPQHSAPLAYICGTLGVLIGADLFHLKDIKKMNAPIASIGGAGTFDGIFFTGILAVLLA